MRRTIKDLSGLDDHILKDIGLSRSQIVAEARRCAMQDVRRAWNF